MTFEEKLTRFTKLFESDRISALSPESLKFDFNIKNCKVSTHAGKKYTKVDCNGSGVYMVDNKAEEIFGIKAYGVPHKGHRFGTLDTIYDYDWGGYRGQRVATRTNVALKSTDELLAARGYHESPKEPEKPAKVFSSDRYSELSRDLAEAKKAGLEAASFVDDSGTCNSDGVFIRLPKFNESQTIEAIRAAGLSGFKTNHSIYGIGFLVSPPHVGQARKNEVAAETMYKLLNSKDYDVSHWQQMD